MAGTYIPKNILQPIIENSILHGICPKADPGNIRLEINRREENVEIIIADDGVGMDHERLESLFNFKKDETVKTPKLRHIGLNNVAQRLEFIFPGKHQFRIESQTGTGDKNCHNSSGGYYSGLSGTARAWKGTKFLNLCR